MRHYEDRHPRVLGTFGEAGGGPLLVVIAGLHGNEPSGVVALLRLFQELDDAGCKLRGRVVALRGNCRALDLGSRWIDRDLNRLWTEEQVDGLLARSDLSGLDSESLEQAGLLEIIRPLLQRDGGRMHLLDLHSTSGDSVPFSIVNHHPASRRLADHFPVPRVFGLHDEIHGTLVSYFDSRGIPALGFEGGRHDSEEAVLSHLAILRVALVFVGILRKRDCPGPGFAASMEYLERASSGLPRVVRVRYRHPVQPRDEFRMLPDLDNFQPVHENQLLARDRRGDVRSPYSGRILMPLYQAQGDDGFFIVDPVG